MSSNTAQTLFVGALTAGLASHLIFKKFEPQAFSIIALYAISFGALLYTLLQAPISHSFLAAFGLTCATQTIYTIALFGSMTLYRLLWHPLRAYPGELPMKVTKFASYPMCWKGGSHRTMLRLHQKYGEYVRIGPNDLSITDVKAIAAVYGANGWDKGPWYDSIPGMKRGECSLLDIRPHAAHARRRRTWDHAFTTQSLQSYQDAVRARSSQFVEHALKKGKEGTELNLQHWFPFFTWDLMMDLAFGGKGLEMMEAGRDDSNFFQAMSTFLQFLACLANTPAVVQVAKYSPPDPLVLGFIQMIEAQYKKRMADDVVRDDIFRHLVAEVDSVHKTKAQNDELLRQAQSDTMLLMVAGADTTGSVLVHLFFFILTNPSQNLWSRLRAEVDAVFEELGEDVDSAVLQAKCPLLEACINETLRVQPPAPYGPLQRISPAGGGTIGDRFIPEHTNVVVAPYAIHRSPKYFSPDPDMFRPERWLDGWKGVHNKAAFFAFSTGPYGCVGKQLAYQEMRHLASAILRNCDARLKDGFDAKEFEASGSKDFFTLQIVKSLPVVFTPRVVA